MRSKNDSRSWLLPLTHYEPSPRITNPAQYDECLDFGFFWIFKDGCRSPFGFGKNPFQILFRLQKKYFLCRVAFCPFLPSTLNSIKVIRLPYY